MIEQAAFSGLRGNLAATYLAIARGISGTEFLQERTFSAALNPFSHPICNFAVANDDAEIDARQLRDIADSRHFFNMYVPHFRKEDEARWALLSCGFKRLYTLVQMATCSRPEHEGGTLREAEVAAERHRISDFMAWQFFSTQNPAIREQICRATESAQELKLLELVGTGIRKATVGAVMLHRTPGVMGLYNVCVGQPYRSSGLGGSMVDAVKNLAWEEHLLLGLQCDPNLEAWYTGLGLVRVGTIDVYGLEKAVKI